MKVFINFIKGFSVTRKTACMVALLFVINLAVSMILAVPMYKSLKDSFGSSLVGERMAEGFDYLWWEEFNDSSTGLEKTFTPSIIGKGAILDNLEGLIQLRFFRLPPVVLVLGILYIIIHTFLAGGILSIFVEENPRFTMKGFFEGAGKYFWRFSLLMLISWLLLITIGSFLFGASRSVLDDIRQNAVSEVTPFYFGLLFSAVMLFFLLFLQMVFDYGRIKIVTEESRNVLKSALGALGFVFKHPVSTLGLYYLIFFVNVAVTVIYIVIKELIPQSSTLEVIIAFLLQQSFIFAVVWLRCWLYSSQLELYRYLGE